jgi:hypothetical protein
MSALLADTQPHHPHVRAVRDARPPSSTWSTVSAPAWRQPPLAFDPVQVPVAAARPKPNGHSVHVVGDSWSTDRPSTLPDPRTWSASLALALAETLQGRRPIGQLSRWLDEEVLGHLSVTLRLRRTASGQPRPASGRPAVLRSVRLQFPCPEAVEVSAHVFSDGRSRALAFRLQGWGDRWLCTALELGPCPV